MAQIINITGNQEGRISTLIGRIKRDFTEKAKSEAELRRRVP